VDLNLTVGGDGRDLASGYSFLFGANGRQSNRILRGDEIVEEKAFAMPKSQGNTHQDWFYVRLERRQTPAGLNFRYSVNGEEVWNYTDSQPLVAALNDPRHMAFWTYNGGLSVARVRLWHSGVESGEGGKATSLVLAADDSNPAGLKNTLGQWQPRREGAFETAAKVQPNSEGTLEIANPQSGGDWTVFVTRTPFDARERPVIKWNYRVQPGVLVNLYARVDGRWREIQWTASATPLPRRRPKTKAVGDPNAAPMGLGADVYAGTSIGRVENVVIDEKWHEASFNLLAALQKAGLPTRVEALSFSAPDRDYLRCGIGGNHLGAIYWIKGFDAPLKAKVAAAPSVF
ncbi:MAG TPA: hypothetical protein VF719_10120, partial [Abditibacteriaceae bacterium]